MLQLKKKKSRYFDVQPRASHKHLGFCRAISNYLEMEQDCDEAERLLIEVTARPEHCLPVSSLILWTDYRKARNDGGKKGR